MGRVRAARLLARQQAIFPATYGLQPPKTSRHPRRRAGLSVSWDQRVRFDTHHDSSTVGNASQSKGHSRLLGASTEASEQQGFLPQSFTPDAVVDLGGLRFKRETGRMPLLEACWLRCPRHNRPAVGNGVTPERHKTTLSHLGGRVKKDQNPDQALT